MTLRLLAAALAVAVAPLAASAADDDHPYKNVKVGDYVTYKLTMKIAGMDATGTVTQTVASKTDKEAKVKTTGKISVLGMEIDIPASEAAVDLTKPFDPSQVNGAGLPAGTDV